MLFFCCGPHVPPPREPLQPGHARRLSSPAFGLLVAIRRPCTSGQGPASGSAKRSCPYLSHAETCVEERSDATSWDQLAKLSTLFFFFFWNRKTNFRGGGDPRPNINLRMGRLHELNKSLCRQSSRRSSGHNALMMMVVLHMSPFTHWPNGDVGAAIPFAVARRIRGWCCLSFFVLFMLVPCT